MAPIISVQSQKLIGWLVERGVLKKEYIKTLTTLSKSTEELTNSLGEKISDLERCSVNYFYCQNLLHYLEKTDVTRDFFGRASSEIRTLRDIVARYQSQNIHLAEVSERLSDLCFQIPKCKAAIADRHKLINDLQKKQREIMLNQQSKLAELERFRKRFGITDEYVRLQLLEKANTVPELLDQFVVDLKTLEPALEFYTSFLSYMANVASTAETPKTPPQSCSTLRLLLSSGHVTVYEWRVGRPPKAVGKNEDYMSEMLAQERKRVDNLKSVTAKDSAVELDELASLEETTVNLDEIDFGDLSESFDIDIIDASDNIACEVADSRNLATKEVAKGVDARHLLDCSDGRRALLNDLEELMAFLLRISDNHNDFHVSNSSTKDTLKVTGGISVDSIAPLYHQIMQDAPPLINSISSDEINRFISAVRAIFDKLNDETIGHLLLLRLQSGYLERLIESMQDLQRQADRAKSKLLEIMASIQQAEVELCDIQTEVVDGLKEAKELISFLEAELSKLYEREIKIIGAAIAL